MSVRSLVVSSLAFWRTTSESRHRSGRLRLQCGLIILFNAAWGFCHLRRFFLVLRWIWPAPAAEFSRVAARRCRPNGTKEAPSISLRRFGWCPCSRHASRRACGYRDASSSDKRRLGFLVWLALDVGLAGVCAVARLRLLSCSWVAFQAAPCDKKTQPFQLGPLLSSGGGSFFVVK